MYVRTYIYSMSHSFMSPSTTTTKSMKLSSHTVSPSHETNYSLYCTCINLYRTPCLRSSSFYFLPVPSISVVLSWSPGLIVALALPSLKLSPREVCILCMYTVFVDCPLIPSSSPLPPPPPIYLETPDVLMGFAEKK